MTFPFMKLSKDFALDDNAAALPGAKLYIYDAGTTTPRTIYSNAAGSATHTNPLIADAAGRFATWFLDPDDGDYKEVLKDTDGVTIYTVDNLPVTPITATAATTPTAQSTPVESATSSFTLTASDVSKVWNVDPTSGDVTVTLTAATGVDDGLWALIRHKGTAGRVIITDGTPAKIRRVLDVPGESVVVVSDNVNWYTIAEAGELKIAAHGDILVADRTATPPSAPTAGTRYLATSGATSPWTANYIYEATGLGTWIEYIPAAGWACFIQDETLRTVYDGSAWDDYSNVTAPTTSVLKSARYELQATNGTGGGTPTAGAWTNDTLAGWVEVSNTTSTVTMATGVWTLAAGTYLITHTRSFYNCNDAQARFKSTTTSTALTSNSIYLNNGSSVGGSVAHQSILTLASSESFSPQYLAGFAAANGLGIANGSLSETERYGTISIVDLTSIQGPQGSTGSTGAGYGGTSTTSVAIGSSGTKTWTTQSGYAYVTGQRVRVAYDASNYIEGTVSSYSGTTFSITADRSVGSGTYTSWTIGVAGDAGATGTSGSAGAGYGGTSAASVALITGSVTWSVASGLAYTAGQRVRVAYDGSNYAEGTITSYSAPNLTVLVDRVVGSGTYSSWTIGIAGDVGATGTSGSPGATGPNTGLDYAFNTATSGDPGSGKLLFNSATIASVTQVNISETGRNAEALAAVIATWDDSTNTAHYGHLRIFDVSDRTKYIELEITGTITDAGAYRTIPVTYTAGGTLPSNGAVLAVMFERTGNKGADGAGTGDVSSSSNFTADNRLVRTDRPTSDNKNVQISGITIDDSNNVSGVGAITLASNDGGALGASGTGFSDLFLASGGVINWNAGDVTITHSSNALAIAGADSGVSVSHSGAVENNVLTTTHSGNGIRWSHGNTNFIGTLGALSGGGAPFIALHAEHGTTANTLRNSGAGVKGMYFSYDGTTLDVKFNGVATASTDFSSIVTGMSMTTAGAVTFASDISNGTSAKTTTGSIELGHATDTTIARSSAGVITVEGETVHTNSTSRTVTAAGIELGHATDTTLSRSAAGELAVEGTLVKKVGKETIFIPASAMISRTTNGAATGTVETTTNKIMFSTLDFDTTTQEFCQFSIRMPKSWNESTVTAAFTWSHASTTTNFGVVWALEAVALSDDDAGDTAFGTAQQVADTGGTTNDVYITSATSAITIAGTPAAEDWVVFQVKRVPSDGSDTMAIDARLHGVTLYFTTDASTDA